MSLICMSLSIPCRIVPKIRQRKLLLPLTKTWYSHTRKVIYNCFTRFCNCSVHQMWHRGPKPVVFGVFTESHSTLHLLQNTFYSIKILVSNWRYTRLIRTNKKVKKSNKMFKNFHVIIIVCNHYFIILKLSSVIKGFILYEIKQTAL